MNSIKTTINSILFDAKQKAGNALIDRAHAINSIFDEARGCLIGGEYASAMECAAEGLRNLDDLLDYANEAMSTTDALAWEFVRDALGTVILEKIPLLPNDSVKEYEIRIKRLVSPTFGDHPRQYVVTTKHGVIRAENNATFEAALLKGELLAAELNTLGATYYWDPKLLRWVLDCLINTEVRPSLKKYM